MSARDDAIRGLCARYGVPLEQVQAGDIIVAHSTGILGWLIRVGTHSQWNHAAVVVDPGDHTPETIQVIQAEAHGVELTTLDQVAPGGYTATLPCPAVVDRSIVVREAHSLLRTKYAFVSIVSIGLKILAKMVHLPLRISIRDDSTLICSAVVALCLFNGGWSRNTDDIYEVTPAEVGLWLGVEAIIAERQKAADKAT